MVKDLYFVLFSLPVIQLKTENQVQLLDLSREKMEIACYYMSLYVNGPISLPLQRQKNNLKRLATSVFSNAFPYNGHFTSKSIKKQRRT